MEKYVTLLIFGCICISLSAQNKKLLSPASYVVSGYVSDIESGERLIGAAVYDTVSHQGAVTNTAGFYTLTIPAGQSCVLVATYVGYQPAEWCAPADTNQTHHFVLHSAASLQEVVVKGHRSLSAPDNVQMSAVEVPVSQILSIPAIGGEVDVLKAIQLLPGVQNGGEGSAGIYVRGGGPDENLMILDGAPLYNINHALGMFSVFNADAIKSVTLYKGNFPARFGSRLSSVVDVWQKDGNKSFWHGSVSAGLISAKAYVEGPILSKTTFHISARRTYFDLFTAPMIAAVAASRNDLSLWAGYYFYDVNAKVSHTFSDADRLTVGVYTGSDVEYMRVGRKNPAKDSNNTYKMGMRYTWGNTLAVADWQHCFNHRLFLHTRAYYSGYRSVLKQTLNVVSADNQQAIFDQGMGYNSQINDVSLSSHLEYTPGSRHQVRAGLEYVYHHFRPAVQSTFLMAVGDSTNVLLDMDTTIHNHSLHGHEASAYVEDTWTPCSWYRLNYGARVGMYGIRGKVYPSFEPRIGMRFLLHRDVAFKLSYSYMSQYVHLLSNSSLSLPSDMWVPVTRSVPPMRSMQVAAGMSYNLLDQVELSVEGYYKRSLNLIEYKDGASYWGYTEDWEKQISIGNGNSYGVEVLAQRTVGPVTGWIGYTWSRTMRQFDDINYGKPFHAKYDREHDISITLQYQITPRIDIAATWVYATGNRGTIVTQTYLDPVAGVVEYFNERNGYVLPDYHRLDLAANFHFPLKHLLNGQKAEHVLNVSCYNVYCHLNPMFVHTDPYTGKMYQITLFPILPSISYQFSF